MNKKRFADAVDEDLKPFDSPSLESFEGVFDMLQDFSLTTADFLEWLKTTRNELRFIAKLDEVQLARVTGIATFFSVSQTNLDELKEAKSARVFGCFIREDDGSISFSEQHTKMYKDWQRAPDRKTVVAGASAIFGIEDAGARATDNAYLESEGDRVEILYAWMIDRAAIEK